MPTAEVSSEPWAGGSVSALARSDPEAAQALRTLHRMVLIDSPTGSEGDLAAYLAGRATELGYDAHVDKAGNLVASLGTSGAPVVMLLGHLDTVPGRVPVRYDGDRLFGRGTVDAKGSLAAMLHAGLRAAAATPGGSRSWGRPMRRERREAPGICCRICPARPLSSSASQAVRGTS